MKHIWVTLCNITTAVICSAESDPFCCCFLQWTAQFNLAVRLSRAGLEGIVQTEKEASKGKCCVTSGGADMLNMLEQYSSASWDLSPVLTLLAPAIVSFSSWLHTSLPQQTSIILLNTHAPCFQTFTVEIFFSPNTSTKSQVCLYLNAFSECGFLEQFFIFHSPTVFNENIRSESKIWANSLDSEECFLRKEQIGIRKYWIWIRFLAGTGTVKVLA